MEWKRGLRSIPLFFLVLLGTAAILIGAVALSGVMNGRSEVLPKVDVAIVGAEGDAMTEKGIRMAGRLEVVKATTKFHFVSEQQAEKGYELFRRLDQQVRWVKGKRLRERLRLKP